MSAVLLSKPITTKNPLKFVVFSYQMTLVLAITSLLSACGGGGGGGNTKPNDSPAPTPVFPDLPNNPAPTDPVLPSNPTLPPVAPVTYSSQIQGLKAEVWRDNAYDGSGVSIAVLDSGLSDTTQFKHLKLLENQEYVYNVNTQLMEKDQSKTATYMNEHGQLMAEVVNGRTVGVANGANLLVGMIAIDGGGYSGGTNMMYGTKWSMENGASIVNLSFGYGGLYAAKDTEVVFHDTLQTQQIFRDIVSRNILIVNSAGNAGESVSDQAYNSGIYNDIASSIAKENVLIAGALNLDGSVSSL